MFIGLNPSTADETEDDPTIRRCVGFANSWGFNAVCMTNLFAVRATNPKDMLAHERPIGERCNSTLQNLSKNAGLIIAAWGVNGGHLNRDVEVKNTIHNMYCLGMTKAGYPKHPLYLKKDTVTIAFNQ